MYICREFSSTKSQKSGRSSSQLKYVQEDEVAEHFWNRLNYVCKSVPVKDNYYLSLFLRGHRGYDPLKLPDFCPPYLREKEFYKLKVVCVIMRGEFCAIRCFHRD